MPCDTPFFATSKRGESVPVPCGKCAPCKKRRVESWVFRLRQQQKVSVHAHFVTLTYGTHCVPISVNGFLTLRKADFQNFMKRLRKLTTNDLKYYACGEYGTRHRRPHYHAIIFNCPSSDLFAQAWTLGGDQLGGVHVGDVTSDSIAYTMKYIDKSNFKFAHGRDDREKEFSLMSKGLGKNYLTDDVIKYHKSSVDRLYVTETLGRRIAMPRYYRKKIYTDFELDLQFQHIQNVAALNDVQDRRKFDLLYPNVDSSVLTYTSWKYSQIEGRRLTFNAQAALKPRDKPI